MRHPELNQVEVELCKELLGKKVIVDLKLVPNMKGFSHYDEDSQTEFECTIVGINKLNCGNNGFGANEGQLMIYPATPKGNWGTIDLRMIKEILS